MSDAATTAAIELLEYQGYTVLEPDHHVVLALHEDELDGLGFDTAGLNADNFVDIAENVASNDYFMEVYWLTLDWAATYAGLKKKVKHDDQDA
jgi:hypothetical protein